MSKPPFGKTCVSLVPQTCRFFPSKGSFIVCMRPSQSYHVANLKRKKMDNTFIKSEEKDQFL